MNPVNFYKLKNEISMARKSINEISSSSNHFDNITDKEEQKTIQNHLDRLKNSFTKINENILDELGKLNFAKPLTRVEEKPKPQVVSKKEFKKPGLSKKLKKELSQLEKETIKRIKRKKMKLESKKIEKPKGYAKTAAKYFHDRATKLSKDKKFEAMKIDLIKTNLEFTPVNYISIILLNNIISIII